MGKNFSVEAVSEALVEVLREVQEMSGKEMPAVSAELCPIGDLDSFDSLSGVEATVMLEVQLGIPLVVETVFVSKEGDRALSISEIATMIASPEMKQGAE